YETVRTALSGTLPQGISLKTDKLSPPVIKPYTWGAAMRGRQVELTGYAPSIRLRDQVKAAADQALSGFSVVNRMAIGAGAPADWQKAASAALIKLSQLRQGSVELRDSQIVIAGLTETEEAADALRRSLKGDIPASFRIDDQIRQDPAVKATEEARRRA